MTFDVLSPNVTWANVVPSGGKLRAGNVLLPEKRRTQDNILLDWNHEITKQQLPSYYLLSILLFFSGLQSLDCLPSRSRKQDGHLPQTKIVRLVSGWRGGFWSSEIGRMAEDVVKAKDTSSRKRKEQKVSRVQIFVTMDVF